MPHLSNPNPYEAPFDDESTPTNPSGWWKALIGLVSIPLILRGTTALVRSWKYSSFGTPELADTVMAAQHTRRCVLAAIAVALATVSVGLIFVAGKKKKGRVAAAALLLASGLIVKLLAW